MSPMDRKEDSADARRVQLHTKRYFLCPSCKKHEFEVEHLFQGPEAVVAWDEISGKHEEHVREVGPWQCDECDATWKVRVHPSDGTIDVVPAPQRSWHNWDVLELARADKTVIRLVVPGLSFERERKLDEELERKRYYYEEHTCPTNYLHSAVIVTSGDPADWGDADPHGLFRFVTTFEHPLRSHQIHNSDGMNVLGKHAWKTLAKLGRS